MVAQAEKTVAIPLIDGVVEGLQEESANGAVLTSSNTRLTASKGTLQRRPGYGTVTGSVPDGTTLCGGVVNGTGDSLALYFKPHHGQRRVCGEDLERIRNNVFIENTQFQNAYFPYQMDDSGQAFTCYSLLPPNVAFDLNGNLWMTVLGTVNYSTPAIFVKVYGPDGTLIVSEREIVRPSVELPDMGEGATTLTFPNFLYLWTGMTQSSEGMTLWYSSDAEINALQMELSGVGGVNTDLSAVITSQHLSDEALVAVDVVSAGQYAYLVLPSSATDVDVYRVDQDTLTSTSVTLTSAYSGTPWVACSHVNVSGTGRVYVAVSDSAGSVYRYRLSTTLTTVWSNSSAYAGTSATDISILPWIADGNDYAVIVWCTAQSDAVVMFYATINASTGALVGSGSVGNRKPQSRGFYHQVSATEIYPYIPTCYRRSLSIEQPFEPQPGSNDYVSDPSVEVVTPVAAATDGTCIWTTVMRYAVDNVSATLTISSNATNQYNGRAAVGYLEARPSMASEAVLSTTRWATFDLLPAHQPSSAIDEGGSSSIAAAYPVVWDGQETVDIAHPHRPFIDVITGSGGVTLPSGTYSFTAVVQWRDASGNLHRSPPATPVTVVDPVTVKFQVTRDNIFRNGTSQANPECVIYGTLDDGSIFYAMDVARDTVVTHFLSEPAAAPTASNEQLYSTGANNEPLLPWCPGALRDIVTIGSRQWAIDAEYPNRLLPSKLKEPGIAFEFAPELAIYTDQQHGKLVKVVDVGGQVRVLAERGVWAISGYGPDNTGGGGGFGDPQLIATLGCAVRHTVATIPGVGVIFQAHDKKPCLLGGGGVKRFETIDAYDLEAPSIYPVQCEVVWPITNSQNYLVYNWLRDAWTHWDGVGYSGVYAKYDIKLGDEIRTYKWTSAGVRTVDSDDVDSSGELVVQRGWIAPEGGDSDCCMREMWLRFEYPSDWSHPLEVRVEFDYGQGPSTIIRNWTAAELATLRRGSRATVGVNLHGTTCRAFKVRVSDGVATGDYMRPIGCEITYAVSSGQQRRALRAGALK